MCVKKCFLSLLYTVYLANIAEEREIILQVEFLKNPKTENNNSDALGVMGLFRRAEPKAITNKQTNKK